MQTEIAAVYEIEGDKVVFDIVVKEGLASIVPDRLDLTLIYQSQNLIGTSANNPLLSLSVASQYVKVDKHFAGVMMHPGKQQNLFLQVQVVQANVVVLTETVKVGLPADGRSTMKLPQNPTFEFDVFDFPESSGPAETPNANRVILAPEIRNYSTVYDFSTPNPPETFEGLVYQGGGRRYWIDYKTNRFVFQTINEAPWLVQSFAFFEPMATNLLPNPFFQLDTDTDQIPDGYSVLTPATTLALYSIAPDSDISDTLIPFKIQIRQNSALPFTKNRARLLVDDVVPVTAGSQYTLSLYTRLKKLNTTTKVEKLTLQTTWLTSSMVEISQSFQDISTQSYTTLELAAATFQAPVGAAFARVEFSVYSVDAGDEVEWTIVGPQFEIGPFATTRCESRDPDSLAIPSYDISNQKIRLQFVPGFVSGTVDPVNIMTGPLNVSVQNDQLLITSVVGNVTIPFVFQAGEAIDLTIGHKASDFFKIYRDGDLISQTATGAGTGVADLVIQGVGFELNRVTVFSRSA